MHAKLTQAVVEKCEPSARDYEIVDTLIPGFVLRVRPSGVKAWEYRYRNRPLNPRGVAQAGQGGRAASISRRRRSKTKTCRSCIGDG